MRNLTVEDTGTGIAAAELPRVFERFHRIPGAQARTYEGTGIGLALVQELVRSARRVDHRHQRRRAVAAASPSRFPDGPRPSSGGAHPVHRLPTACSPAAATARLFVEEASRWIPDAPASALEAAADEQRPGWRRRGHVAARRRQCRHARLSAAACSRNALQSMPCRTAWRRCHLHGATPVDLVLTDVMMPRMDGFELLRELRADARTQAMPVILLRRERARNRAWKDSRPAPTITCVKPFTVRELLARVETHIHMARVRRESAALQESELRFRTMADCAPVMMLTLGPDRRCDYLNKGWLEFTGRTLAEQLDEGWTLSVHPEDRAALGREPLRSVRRRREIRNGVSSAPAATANTGGYLARALLASWAPLHFLGYVFSCVDIDDRKRAVQPCKRRRNGCNWLWTPPTKDFGTGTSYRRRLFRAAVFRHPRL